MATTRRETLLGAVGGAAAGYVLWLAAFSVVDDNATVGQWGPTVLALSVLVAVGAVLWGSVLRRRRKYAWSGLAFGLPVVPVVLTLAVLADVYL